MNTNSRINFLAASVVAALTLGGCSVFMDGPTPLPVSIEASGHDGNGPDRLIDGDIKTRWSASGAGSWAVVDYGVKAKFNAVKLAFHKGDQRASIFDVETSIDGENWTKVLSQARSSGATLNLERFEFADIQARFIRVTGYGNSSNKWNSFTEFVGVNCNVDDCPDSELPPLTPVAVTSSEHDGNGPDRLIDGDIKTRWSASGDGSWAILDYGSVQEFDAVRLAFHKGNKRSTYFDIEFSEDGDNWKPIITDGKSSGVFKTRERFEFEPAKAQYVRYVGHGNSSNKWNSVTEFSAVNCSINDCPVDEVKTEALIAEAKRKAAEKKAKKKAEKSKPKARPGDFGIHVPLVCDPVVSDCSCLKTNPECQWWETPLPAINVPAIPQPGNKPGQNFDLGGWYLSMPMDHDANGKPDDVFEPYLSQGFEHPEMFYTAKDGGLVFKSYIKGVRTSNNTKYVRTEMREMLRRGDMSIPSKGVNKNNWVFSSAPVEDQKAAGGVDGVLEATLKIDHTTTTGELGEVGRFIIGQIHDRHDEPIRLYFRKLPNRDTGTVYFAHENTNEGSDNYYDLVGGMTGIIDDGIALGEVFSYRIEVVGNTMTVTLMREGKPDAVQVVDMSKSGYDVGGKYMYFKAGVYNQNRSGDPDDYIQATFYKIKATHGKYK